MSISPYTEAFYNQIKQGSRQSAREIVPLVLQLVKPKSVLDVGCGIGTWLSVFQEQGIEDIFGVDGGWVEPEKLEIPPNKFLSIDLQNPLQLDRQFDLVMSLEVAEHLPEEAAEQFVNSIVSHGKTFLFSAAIPFQGGVNHINEQWPEYWIKLFQERGCIAIDCIRKKFWSNKKVAAWYSQNAFMFVKASELSNYPLLEAEIDKDGSSVLSLVHPVKYLHSISQLEEAQKELKEVKSKLLQFEDKFQHLEAQK